MKVINNWSIKRKILLPAVGGVSVVGLSLFIYFMYTIYSMQHQNLNNIANRTVGILTHALEYPVVSGNISEIDGLVDWLMKQPEIESITIKSNDKTLLSRQQESNTSSRYLNIYKEDIISRPTTDLLSPSDEYDPTKNIDNEKVIGTLIIVVSNKKAEEEFFGEAIVALFVFTPFLVAVLSIGLLIIGSTNQSFMKILEAISNYRKGDLNARIKVDQNNDIGQIAYQFNNMAQTIQEKENKLTEATTLQNRFMSTMSHDLRSPLGVVLSSIELTIDRDDLPPSAKMNLKSAMMAAKQLLKLIDDIISVNRIAKEGELLSIDDMDIVEALTQSIETLKPSAEIKGLHLFFNSSIRESLLVRGDETKFIRIINNLLSNAIKFTLSGSIHIQANFIEKEGGVCQMNLSIKDTGIGIPEEEIENIFKPFKRVDNFTTSAVHGSGLGLSIVSEYVYMMKGEINIHSKPELGSIFEVTIPFPYATKSQKKVEENIVSITSEKSKYSILFVDDNIEYHRIVKSFFGMHDIHVCNNGIDALSIFKSEKFDLVILDCHMPGMDGFEVASQIRKYEEIDDKERTPILALTANAVPETKAKSKKSGMDDYMTKPFTRIEISEKVSYWLNNGNLKKPS